MFELELLFNGSVPVDRILNIENQGVNRSILFMGREFSIVDVEFGSGNLLVFSYNFSLLCTKKTIGVVGSSLMNS